MAFLLSMAGMARLAASITRTEGMDRRDHFAGLNVAIVHYWLVGMRGGEKVVEELCNMFPQADIFTHVARPERLSARIREHRIVESFIGRLPGAKSHYQSYLPFMPRALEGFDLTGYDLVISSEAGPAKGVICDPDATHVCYCHSPMRYIWDQYHVYRAGAGTLARLAMPWMAHGLRVWDQTSAARVDHIVSNSSFIQRRVAKSWGRESEVIHPPVDLEAFAPATDPAAISNRYLYVGELIGYKRPDLVVDAFNASGRALTIIGDGAERRRLQQKAGPNIRFLGRAPFEVLKHEYAHCRALVFPGVEDFGIVPLESMASGRPVIAFGKGGALETVLDGVTGSFFYRPTAEALNTAIQHFETDLLNDLDHDAMARHVTQFGRNRFRKEMTQSLLAKLAKRADRA